MLTCGMCPAFLFDEESVRLRLCFGCRQPPAQILITEAPSLNSDKQIMPDTTLLDRINELEYFVRDVATNYDCDSDAHRYGTRCRQCEANKLLSKNGERQC